MQFYEDERFLAEAVADLVAEGLVAGDPIVIVVTEAHGAAVKACLAGRSVEIAGAVSSGQLTFLDAAVMLAKITRNDEPNAELFTAHVASAVRSARSKHGERPLRIFGEIVDLLWKRGDSRAAVRLEEMWNDLARREELLLLCGYAMENFSSEAQSRGFAEVCEVHSHVSPTEALPRPEDDGARLRQIALLEQRARALEAEVQHRHVLEQELRDREAELRDFIENGAEGIHWVGPDGIILLANAAELELLGYSRDEYVGHHIREFHADDAVIDQILDRLCSGDTLKNEHARLRCKDGSIKHVLIHSNVYWRDGKFVHTRCFTRDITDRMHAEDALRQRTDELERTVRQLRAVVQQMPSAVVIVEAPSGRIVLSNDKSDQGRFLGFHEDGRAIGPEEWPLARSIRTGEIVKGEEIRVVRGDRTQGFIRVSSAPIRDEEGHVVQGVATYEDVTAQKEAQVALREQSRINENLARIASALSSELDLDRLVQRLTDEATALCRAQFGAFLQNVVSDKGESYVLSTMSGISKEAFSTLPMPRNTALFDPTFSGAGVIRLDDVTKDARYGKNAPHHGIPAGHPQVRSYLAVPVTSRSGEVLGGLFFGHVEAAIFTDADERVLVAAAAQAAVAIDNAKLFQAARRAEEAAEREREKLGAIAAELENANRTKDDFLATVSHELRTPLNAILGWVRMLRAGGLPADKKERALETIERNANAQTQLIEDLLDVSRIISGKLRLDVGTVDLPIVVENAIEAVKPAAHAKGINLQLTMDPAAGPILGDPDRLQQIVWNLLTNAVKFTPKGGAVQIATRKRDSSIEVIVGDSGQGIDPAFLPKVFERFRQADATTSRSYGGLGLGLAIVRHLVELHGGTVSVESEGLGRGSTFTVCLPISPLRSSSLERPPALRLTASPHFQCPQELAGIHVLVVDDEPDARDLLSEVLTSCNARVTAAASAAEALRLVQELRPDVVVSDIGMPEEDGYVLIRKLRALPASQGGRTPVVALTAYARFEDRTRALVAGFNMHVPKPVEPTELLAVLSSLTTLFTRAGAS